MKIRLGFVSNSSASSYIIKINESHKCPTCGRSDFNIINLLEKSNNEDSGIIYNSKEEILESYRKDIEIEKSNIEKYNKMDPSKKYETYGWLDSLTVGELLDYSKKTFKEIQEKIEKINNLNGDIYQISISYDDVLLNKIFEDCKNNGTIEVIENYD